MEKVLKSPKFMFLACFLLLAISFSGCCGYTNARESSYYTGESSFLEPTPDLDASIVGCNTHFGLDGETTTVWVTISNTGDGAAEDVSVLFEANDGDYTTPPQAAIGRLPASKKITLSRSVDTSFGTQTDIKITVTAKDTSPIIGYSASCRQMDDSTIANLNALVRSGLIPI